MSYIQNFKKFIKSDEKKTQEMGANPVVAEQDAQAATTPAEPAKVEAPVAQSPSIEGNPAVISAKAELANAIAARDKAMVATKAAQDGLVNAATLKLNNAIAAAAKTPTV